MKNHQKIIIIFVLVLVLSSTLSYAQNIRLSEEDKEDISNRCYNNFESKYGSKINSISTSIQVHGTEYNSGDSGKIFLQLSDSGVSINNASCSFDMYFPNNTVFIQDQLMTSLAENGLYYHDETVPSYSGVYMVSAQCIYSSVQENFTASNISISKGTNLSGSVSSLHESDDDKFVISEELDMIDFDLLKVSGNNNWWDTDWTKRKEINLSNVGTTELVDFPIFVNVTKDSDMQNDYDDIRFLNGSCESVQSKELSYEIENYTSSRAITWVRMPRLFLGNTTVCMYYGNPSASNGENITGTWNSNYVMVHHLSETDIDGGAGDILDSTSFNNDGTTSNMEVVDQEPGRIGGSFHFDGVNELVNAGSATSLDITQGTYELWVYWDDDSGALESPMSKDNAGVNAGDGGIHIQGNAGNVATLMASTTLVENMVDSNAGIPTGTWAHITGLTGTGGMLIFVDGVQQTDTDTFTGGWSNAGATMIIGARRAGIDHFDGLVDEVRVSNVRRSSAWINQSYQSMVNNPNVIRFGNEEESGVFNVTDETSLYEDGLTTTSKTYSLLDFSSSSFYNLTTMTSIPDFSSILLSVNSTSVKKIYLHENSTNASFNNALIYASFFTNGSGQFENVSLTLRNITSAINNFYISDGTGDGNSFLEIDFLEINGPDTGEGLDFNVTFQEVLQQNNTPLELYLSLEYQWSDPGELLNVNIYDFNTSSFLLLDQLSFVTSDTEETYFIQENTSHFISESNTVVMRFNGSGELGAEDGTFSIDLVSGMGIIGIGLLTDVKGSGEWHVKSKSVSISVGNCPENIESVIFLGLIIFISLILILMGHTSTPVFGILGGIGLLISSWSIAGCISIIATLIAIVGIINIVIVSFKKNE